MNNAIDLRLVLLIMLLVTAPACAETADPPSVASASPWTDLLAEGLDQWTVDASPETHDQQAAAWTLEDGVLVNAGGGFGFLRYKTPLRDFEFRGEYRLPKKGNSGIGLRSVPFTGERSTRPSFAAYELQLLDDSGEPASIHSTASLYRYKTPMENRSKEANHWNSIVVRCQGPHIRVSLNGEVVLDFDQSQDAALADKPQSGYLLLQNHGSKAEFRNLQLRELR